MRRIFCVGLLGAAHRLRRRGRPLLERTHGGRRVGVALGLRLRPGQAGPSFLRRAEVSSCAEYMEQTRGMVASSIEKRVYPRNLVKWYYICQQLNSQPTTRQRPRPLQQNLACYLHRKIQLYSLSPFVSLFASHLLQDHQARLEIIHLLRAPPILQTHPMNRLTPKHWQPNHHHRIKRPRESFREIKSSSPLGHDKSLTGGCSAFRLLLSFHHSPSRQPPNQQQENTRMLRSALPHGHRRMHRAYRGHYPCNHNNAKSLMWVERNCTAHMSYGNRKYARRKRKTCFASRP